MECAPKILDTISLELERSLQSDCHIRRQAEFSLASSIAQPDFAHALLAIAVSDKYDDKIRLAASRYFKDLIRRRWPKANGSDDHLPAIDCSIIKSGLLNALLVTNVHVLTELSKAMAAIAAVDFPKNWSSILPEIVSHLTSVAPSSQSVDHWDLHKIKALLTAALCLFSHFDNDCAAEDGIKYYVDKFASHLKRVSLSLQLAAHTLQCLSLCCRIFYSIGSIKQPARDMNSIMDVDIPSVFEPEMSSWMSVFEPEMSSWMTWFYNFVNNSDLSSSGEDGLALRASAMDILRLYIENRWSWDCFTSTFLTEFLNILRADLRAARDGTASSMVTLAALRLLTEISKTMDFQNLVRDAEIYEGALSVLQTYTDVRLFKDDWIQYIKCYSKEHCKGTVRWNAFQLLHGLMVINEQKMDSFLSHNVQKMLIRGAQWMEKDAAIYLSVALLQGGLPISGLSVDTIACKIVPELHPSAEPMLQATVIRFFIEFRESVHKNIISSFLPNLPKLLSHQSGVVRYNAAVLVENMCTMDCFASADIIGIIQNLCTGLSFEDHGNPYLLKCLVQVLGAANVGNAKEITDLLMNAVRRVCSEPKTPECNHYLFEAVAVLIHRAGNVHDFEKSVFPVLYEVLDKEIHEFWPYTFQIAAQICRTSQMTSETYYRRILDLLGNDSTWSIRDCVPSIICFLQEVIQKCTVELKWMIDIFFKLAQQRSTYDCAFSIVNKLVEIYPRKDMDTWMPDILTVLLEEALSWKQTGMTPEQMKFTNSLVVFMSIVIVKYDLAFLVNHLKAALEWDSLEVKRFVNNIWLARIARITRLEGSFEDMMTTIGLTKLLCEYEEFSGLPKAAGIALDWNLQLLVGLNQAGGQSGPNMMDRTCLKNAGTFVHSLLKGKNPIEYPSEFLATSLRELSAKQPGFLPLVIKDHLSQHSKDVLQQLVSYYQINII